MEEYSKTFSHELNGIWFNANSNLDWRVSGKPKKWAKEKAYFLFRNCPKWQKAKLTVTVRQKSGRRFDLDNIAITTKPLIDGAVRAGILPDDDSKHLTEITYRAGEGKSRTPHEITLTFTREE